MFDCLVLSVTLKLSLHVLPAKIVLHVAAVSGVRLYWAQVGDLWHSKHHRPVTARLNLAYTRSDDFGRKPPCSALQT